jgi:hypothetical protein
MCGPVFFGGGYRMQSVLLSIVSHVVELGVFFAAAAALTFGAVALR